jgi:hypothetical protein
VTRKFPNVCVYVFHPSPSSASNLRHLYAHCALCALARQRFPTDDFGMDFHCSHLQFFQPELNDSDDEEVPKPREGDLEAALSLSIGEGTEESNSVKLQLALLD